MVVISLLVHMWSLTATADAQPQAGPDCLSPAAGLVGWWPLDEVGGTTTADFAGTNHGTLFGPVFATGKVGNGLSFDGVDDVVSIPHSASLQPTKITVGAWIKAGPSPKVLIVDKSHGSIEANGFIESTGWALQIWPSGRPSWAYGNGSGFPEVTAGSIVTDNQFHHVAGTLDGSTLRIYIDGAFAGSRPFRGTPSGNTRPVHIGAFITRDVTFMNFTRHFNGVIDEVEIFNRALTAHEIEAIYLAGSTGRCKNSDRDEDGVLDAGDNCPDTANADQADADGDGVGDACDVCEGHDDRADCNLNDAPDGCEIADGDEADCNGNGVPDSCEIIETFEPIIVLDEGFETDVFPPPGWTTRIEQGPATWQQTTDPADVFLGSGAALHPWEPGDAQFDTWLLSPEIELTEGGFTVWTMGCFGQPWCPNYTVDVMIVVGEPGGGDDMRIGALEDLWSNNFEVYSIGTADLGPLVPDGPFRIGFHYVGRDGAEALIDSVRVTGGTEPPLNDQNRDGLLDECERGDFDADGDVDLGDLLILQSCFTGADQTVTAGCREIDMDGDGDVDLADLVSFLERFTGAQ